jgi:hypothetical protein
MFMIVILAAGAAAGPLEVSALPVGLAVAVAVPVPVSLVELSDPPHAVATAATRHMAAQNNPNLFIVTPISWTLRKTRFSIRNGSKEAGFRAGTRSTVRSSAA